MNKKIQLSDNHTRTLSSSLILVEKSLSELESILTSQDNNCCNVLVKDVDDETIEKNISVIKEAKMYICELADKYGTSKEEMSLQRFINAKKVRMWEMLTDTLSRKIKGYGPFPKKYSGEYDADVSKLIEITNRINC